MVYDQNRPEEPQRPPGDDKPARRRMGRSWAPPEETAEDGGPQGPGQQEPYRFDPDRGRRHRYSEDTTGQLPNVPVEITETGPMVPATRRAAGGDQFEPIPPAPQHQQPDAQSHPQAQQPPRAPQSRQDAQGQQSQQQGQFAPSGVNQEFSAPSGVNQEFSAPPESDREHGAPSAPDPSLRQPGSAPADSQTPVSPPNPPQHAAAGPSAPPTPQPPPPPAEAAEPPSAPQTSAPPTPTPSAPTSMTSPPHPPVTEQHPPRTPPVSRQPLAEPTPPVTTDESPADPEAEALLDRVRRVPGVRDAYHVTAPDGGPSLRLELDEGVDPDEVHATVSAVVNDQRPPAPRPQVEEEPPAEPRSDTDPAPVEAVLPSIGTVELRRVEIHSAGLEADVSVTLATGGQETVGSVVVPPVDWHVDHAVASATVEALRPQLGSGETRVEVEHTSIVPTGPISTAVVVVLWLGGRSVRRLAGASPVASERFRAIVSATLSALAAEVAH